MLAPGQIKRFCGVYLDCHLGVSVDEVRAASSVGDPGRTVMAKGKFQIVTLRLSVTEQALPDVVLEWFLIGDEDGLFHQPTLLSLAPATVPGARDGQESGASGSREGGGWTPPSRGTSLAGCSRHVRSVPHARRRPPRAPNPFGRRPIRTGDRHTTARGGDAER